MPKMKTKSSVKNQTFQQVLA